MNKLTAKIFITGKIKVETGLHIGGSKTALDIGGIDLNVIKTANGVPFIPGSSLKGKLRSILAREEGSEKVETDSDLIKQLFGDPGRKEGEKEIDGEFTRLIVRDAFLDVVDFENKRKNGEFSELELDYTEGKWENTIERKSGKALHPRQLERVPAGAIFDFELVYNVLDDNKEEKHLTAIKKAMRILEDDYLGGQGSRGYGKIKFENVKFEKKTIKDYQNEADQLIKNLKIAKQA